MDLMGMLQNGGAEAIGSLADTGYGIYGDLQKLNLARRQARDSAKQDQFKRLMALLDSGQGVQDRLGGAQRLFALRNPGV